MNGPPLFRIEGLVVDRGDFVLRVDELEIPVGRPTLLLGPTAAGKSTLLAALARLETPWLRAPGGARPRGRILYHPAEGSPVDLLTLSEQEIARRGLRGAEIGMVPQGNGLFTARSVVENVAWPLRRRGVARDAAIRRTRAALGRTGGPPEGRPVPRLSGGESKRLAIARALALEPRALLLDEPFTGLDPESMGAAIALVRELAPATTPIVVTHQPRAARALDGSVVFVRDGRIDWAGETGDGRERIDRFLEEVAQEEDGK